MPNPLVIIHGYSDKGQSFLPWAQLLHQKGIPVENISICSWISLNNEVTVKDIAEAFDRALTTLPNLSNGEPFDALVHSTGIRSGSKGSRDCWRSPPLPTARRSHNREEAFWGRSSKETAT